MLACHYLIQAALRSGFATLISDANAATRACDGLPITGNNLLNDGVNWWTTRPVIPEVHIEFPDQAPVAPSVILLLDPMSERDDQPIGQGQSPDTNPLGSGGWVEVTKFRVGIRALCLAESNVMAMYLQMGVLWSLLATRKMTQSPYDYNLPGYGVQEQVLEAGALGAIEYPQWKPSNVQGCYVTLRGTSFAEFDFNDTLINHLIVQMSTSLQDVYGYQEIDVVVNNVTIP